MVKMIFVIPIFLLSHMALAQDGNCPRLEGLNTGTCMPQLTKPCDMIKPCPDDKDGDGISDNPVPTKFCKKKDKVNRPKKKSDRCPVPEEVKCEFDGERQVCTSQCNRKGVSACKDRLVDCHSDCQLFDVVIMGCLCCPPEGCPEWCAGGEECRPVVSNADPDYKYKFKDSCNGESPCRQQGYSEDCRDGWLCKPE